MKMHPEQNMIQPMVAQPAMMPSPCGCESYLCMPKCAHAYVPFQYLCNVYPPMKALERYTMFPELDRPYGTDPEYTVDA